MPRHFPDAPVSGKYCRKIQGLDRQGFSPVVFRLLRVEEMRTVSENLLSPGGAWSKKRPTRIKRQPDRIHSTNLLNLHIKSA
jgi:hypothetical protein